VVRKHVTFNELVRVLERNGFQLRQEKGSVRYYTNPSTGKDVRIDYHGSREVPGGTLAAILKQAGLRRGRKAGEG
jgi:predicted RNA binding protein YcfA (HicA-like mRNA interferase family)